MLLIHKSELPEDAFLAEYILGNNYTDCYVAETASVVSQAEYVTAFYTTTLFKIERLILRWLVRKPSSDSQARQLADGERDTFAARYVEKRSEDQLLMCDFRDKTGTSSSELSTVCPPRALHPQECRRTLASS